MTLQNFVSGLAPRGDSAALISMKAGGSDILTFADLSKKAARVTDELHRNDVKVGEPIAILAPNGQAWVVTCIGILAAGAAVMPLDFRQPEEERNALLARGRCRLIYAGDDSRPPSLGLQYRENAVVDANARTAKDLMAGPTDSALVMSTSGTTGPPKIAVLSHANVMSNIRALISEELVGPGDRALLPLPLHHIYPLVVGLLLPLATGATVVFPAGMSGPQLSDALRAGRVTMLVGVPRLYDAFLSAILDGVRARGRAANFIFERTLGMSVALTRRGRRNFGRIVFRSLRGNVVPSLWRLACGGAALKRQTEESLLGLGYDVVVGYGLTETAPLLTFNRVGHARIGSAGTPLPGTRVRISNPDVRGIGEIEASGENVFSGYEDAAATNRAFTPDGWFRTGDLGRLDADGYLYVEGRIGEALVLAGGEKLNPEDLERRYETSSAIGEIGISVDEGKLVGLVVPSASIGTSTRDLREARIREALTETANELPSYMHLAGFAVTDRPLPRTPIGKLRRFLLPMLYRDARQEELRVMQETGASIADRGFLGNPLGRRLWSWLEARFRSRQLSPEMSLELDLGVDSLEAVAMTMDLERELGITLDEAALEKAVTLRDLINVAIAGKERHLVLTTETLPRTAFAATAVWIAGIALVRALVRILFHLRVQGIDRLPARGPYVLCANHTSYLDGPALATALPWPALRDVWWTGGIDVMFSTPVRRAFSRLAHVLPIDRAAHGTRAGLALSALALRRGGIVVWFPEGWLSKNGTLQPFLPGIGSLVGDVPVPIVPVYIEGTFGAWLPQHRLPRPRRVTVHFGTPLEPARWTELKAAVMTLQASS